MNVRAARTQVRNVLVLLAASTMVFLAGCGLPAAPSPPSLLLPQPITDLAASRQADVVHLTWTNPRRATDKVLLKRDIAVHICRQLTDGSCQTAADIQSTPGSDGSFDDALPAALAQGPLRALGYVLELRNHAGRSAGPSNVAWTASGAAPPQVAGDSAHISAQGVVLRWQVDAGASSAVMRIRRTRILPPGTPPAGKDSGKAAEPLQQRLEAGDAAGGALDRDARFDAMYRYRLERVARISVAGLQVEVLGAPGSEMAVNTRDTFPPAVPAELAAVADAAGAAIDLSWAPDTEPDLAGYVVYRSVQGSGKPERISSPGSVVAPSFHDTHLTPGQRYTYAVSAVDRDGNESARSAEVEELLPEAQ